MSKEYRNDYDDTTYCPIHSEWRDVGYLDLNHNLDFSSFPHLVKTVYNHLVDTYKTILPVCPPYAVFLHVCTGMLNGILLAKYNETNVLERIYGEIYLPRPIINYLQYIYKTLTVSRCVVRLNIPQIALPRIYSPDQPEIPAGTFGPVTAENHNVYECYVSPYVTRKYVEATIKGVKDWEPLPEHMRPPGAVPNRNLLGYDPGIQILSDHERNFLNKQALFDDKTELRSRLHWSDTLGKYVSDAMKSLKGYYEVSCMSDLIGLWSLKNAPNMIAFVQTPGCSERRQLSNDEYLGSLDCNVHSLEKHTDLTLDTQHRFGLKRKRLRSAPGLCYTLKNKEAIEGWMDHINDNFAMKGAFKARNRRDVDDLLRYSLFQNLHVPRRMSLHHYISSFEKAPCEKNTQK